MGIFGYGWAMMVEFMWTLCVIGWHLIKALIGTKQEANKDNWNGHGEDK